jgi:hypothetical protein
VSFDSKVEGELTNRHFLKAALAEAGYKHVTDVADTLASDLAAGQLSSTRV